MNKEVIIDIENPKDNDLISRQAVLDLVNSDWKYEGLELDIENLPSVKPQEKTGHWIRGHHGFGCSNCHKSIEGEWDNNIDDITGTLFCPNCGARMVESQESELENPFNDSRFGG